MPGPSSFEEGLSPMYIHDCNCNTCRRISGQRETSTKKISMLDIGREKFRASDKKKARPSWF